MLTSFPAPLLAGDMPLDNRGRVACTSTGRIEKREADYVLRRNAPRELSIGETITIPAICPAERYFPTGVLVTSGAEYLIDSQGLWMDGGIVTGPDGWPGAVFQAWNRIPWRRFFMLSGSIGESEHHLFPIGRTSTWRAPEKLNKDESSEIFLFANDWPGDFFYGNNRTAPDSKGGPLRVTIRRLK